MPDRAQRIELPDGTEVWARVSRLEGPGSADGYEEDGIGDYEDVGAWEALTTRVEGLKDLVGGVAASVRAATERVAPHETSVTFGVEVSAKPGKAVALLADGEAKANLSLTLTWRREEPLPSAAGTPGPGGRPGADGGPGAQGRPGPGSAER